MLIKVYKQISLLVWLVLSEENRTTIWKQVESWLFLYLFSCFTNFWGMETGSVGICTFAEEWGDFILPGPPFILGLFFLTVCFSFSSPVFLSPNHRRISPLSLASYFLSFSSFVSVLKRHLCARGFCRIFPFHLQLQTSF